MEVMTASETERTVGALWRIESPRLIAALARLTRDIGLAEELAQDALVEALERWPVSGIPRRPGAWLMTVARRRALNALARRRMIADKHEALAHEPSLAEDPDDGAHHEGALAGDDDLLRLIFCACHPVLTQEARVALTLRVLCGLGTDEIARAFLCAPTTMQQRIVRAKRALAEARVPFELPDREALPERLGSVLAVIYLVFNEGYAATSGDAWLRKDLCEDAMRLGRMLAELMPEESEVHGLVALMELNASRFPARLGPDGAPILLLDQDRRRWDRLLIRRGLARLERAQRLCTEPGFYALQAAIVACHARAARADATDWAAIAALYARLEARHPSPIVRLNRAVAVGMAEGAERGLALVDTLGAEPTLASYASMQAVRGDLLERLGRLAEAEAAFQRAATLTRNTRERAVLEARAARCRERAAGHAGQGERRQDERAGQDEPSGV